ncbi:hypothetical protein FOZ63_033153 [Perkinsus olseni]|uniref:Uncharacterized protein n=1 Tax=Perkinsus olseni TaxID=32597 RepID=A0A7J6Q8A1_PEROL|nr:hypothetical protein FOZ63_033153 [Perkinsus olseni]KAF4710227.1 hypothetical protein FOZ62_028867 [Perkinsus olseni]
MGKDVADASMAAISSFFSIRPRFLCSQHYDSVERTRLSAMYGIVKYPEFYIEDLVLSSVDPVPAAYRVDFEAVSVPGLTLKVLGFAKDSKVVFIHWKGGKSLYRLSHFAPPEY